MIIKKDIKQIIQNISGLRKIKTNDSFKYDLYLDIFDMVDLVMECESYFEIEIEDEEFESWTTVADVIETVIETVKGKL
jgi:acyl carrier protein